MSNQVVSGKGTWNADDNKAVLKAEHTSDDSQTNKAGYAFSKVDADTMKVEVFEVYGSDELADYPNFTREYKWQKK